MAKPKRPKATDAVGPPPGYAPPSGDTPSASRIRPPSTHRETLLPLADVGSRKFEEMCRDLAPLAFPDLVQRVSLKRMTGTRQFGADVEGFDEDGEPAVVISAKCYRRIRGWDFRPWLDEFVRHLDGHWAGRRIRHFVLAIMHEANDDAMNEAARALKAELDRRGIKFHLWNAEVISRHLRRVAIEESVAPRPHHGRIGAVVADRPSSRSQLRPSV